MGVPVANYPYQKTTKLKLALVAARSKADSLMMDWSQPVGPAEDELVLKWDDDEEEDSDPDTGALQMKTIKSSEEEPPVETTGAESGDGGHLDIMAQQLKFVACLKILMEELSTLATGFEVDGGQLRYQLYVWLEREVDALRQLCNYSAGDADAIGAGETLGDTFVFINFNIITTHIAGHMVPDDVALGIDLDCLYREMGA
ncbi:unnamed protein product [Timema podura]|uniref:Uncharacterized protein n=1 Tax=Timema podura TaxID=61482 RepID=A0ABN7NK28_TIMPD|nr:unnamed protein product [Timema podura]